MMISSSDRSSNGMVLDRSPPIVVDGVLEMGKDSLMLGSWQVRFKLANLRIPRGKEILACHACHKHAVIL